ncbi:hypothetical protein IEQ34_015099 [Dendrobium chrysotoxum]|uniref:Glutathione S-transferase n=1 Tax=Dendrobium chrysotoxum TaxID=161865 RepID=A0AAV7GMG1_DENCH|nr:hypothetical protein IEQ34_015099 [Dendrobium chrysotoxum]
MEEQRRSEAKMIKTPVALLDHKKVPVLPHGCRPPISESLIILSNVDEEWPNPPLLPSTKRAVAGFWADFVDRTFFPAAIKIWRNKVPGEELESGKKELLEALKKLEDFLGDRNFFGGDSFGLVDIALIPFASWTYS